MVSHESWNAERDRQLESCGPFFARLIHEGPSGKFIFEEPSPGEAVARAVLARCHPGGRRSLEYSYVKAGLWLVACRLASEQSMPRPNRRQRPLHDTPVGHSRMYPDQRSP